ncbi:hypothetical protein [Kribbella sp. VKM Ac-2566]|uniref:hypothetical protein n=1 Tax=Kribbella sp. VKM Ac-2566 TaxID=2512218 RepID=UPI001EE0EA90|nr:hypothetical protein [Kribbella sp. VKM Ac-2566]
MNDLDQRPLTRPPTGQPDHLGRQVDPDDPPVREARGEQVQLGEGAAARQTTGPSGSSRTASTAAWTQGAKRGTKYAS